MEVSGQLHAPAALLPGEKSPRYFLDRRLGGPPEKETQVNYLNSSVVEIGFCNYLILEAIVF
jgi:hypothetical protein